MVQENGSTKMESSLSLSLMRCVINGNLDRDESMERHLRLTPLAKLF